jgi:carboxyl-terminal processing protease
MRAAVVSAIALLLAAPCTQGHAQSAPTPAASIAAPATAASRAAPDRPSLADIRNFTRVYEIIRQAYVRKVDNKTLMSAAIKGMLRELDPHSAYLDRKGMRELSEETSGHYAGLGVMVTGRDHQLVVIAPIDDTPADKAGIKPGDVILKIDDVPVDPKDVEASIDKLRGKPGSKITLTLVHDTNGAMPFTKTLMRALITMSSVHLRALEPGYLYIRISQFQAATADNLNHKLEQWIGKHGQPKGTVLDLRSNPGGLVSSAAGAADTFLNGGLIVRTRGRVHGSDMRLSAHPGDLLKGAPMVALVDHGTASAAEILAGALKDHHRALIMGQRTFGKGVVQTVIPVGADHVLKLTTARYYTPEGTSIQAQGIKPDIRIPDLVARAGNTPPTLIGSEADLPHHLANEHPQAPQVGATASARTLAKDSKLAEQDYALAQALSVLKGMVLARQQTPDNGT